MTPRQLVAAALRSGKYQQGKNALCEVNSDGNTTYCCLGVACEVYQEHVAPLRINVIHHLAMSSNKTFNEAVSFLPAQVQQWLGMNESGDFGADSLIHCNDQKDYTFEQIANLFETQTFEPPFNPPFEDGK